MAGIVMRYRNCLAVFFLACIVVPNDTSAQQRIATSTVELRNYLLQAQNRLCPLMKAMDNADPVPKFEFETRAEYEQRNKRVLESRFKQVTAWRDSLGVITYQADGLYVVLRGYVAETETYSVNFMFPWTGPPPRSDIGVVGTPYLELARALDERGRLRGSKLVYRDLSDGYFDGVWLELLDIPVPRDSAPLWRSNARDLHARLTFTFVPRFLQRNTLRGRYLICGFHVRPLSLALYFAAPKVVVEEWHAK